MRIVYFSAGCFWGVEKQFNNLEGVIYTSVGYMGGNFINPTYNNVLSGKTGHAETVQVVYNYRKISYKQLCEFFFKIHDSKLLNKQGANIGTQYKSIVFYNNNRDKRIYKEVLDALKYKTKVKTLLLDKTKYAYYRAEEYHQKYLNKKK